MLGGDKRGFGDPHAHLVGIEPTTPLIKSQMLCDVTQSDSSFFRTSSGIASFSRIVAQQRLKRS